MIAINRKILVVEDDAYLRFIYKKSIETKLGFEVKTAGTWREGKAFFLHQIFDLIILDLGLPDVSGIDVLKEIRELKSEQKVLVASAYGTKENILLLAKYKANGFIVKPFTMEMLISKIKNVLGVK